MQLVQPSLDRLPSYVAALKRGWSPDNVRGVAASIEELAQIEKDAGAFVERDFTVDCSPTGRDGLSGERCRYQRRHFTCANELAAAAEAGWALVWRAVCR